MEGDRIRLVPMTDEMYRRFFKEYENDPDLLRPGQAYEPFRYSAEWADRYIRRQTFPGRLAFAILLSEDIAGEIVLKNIEPNARCDLSITLKNDGYKGRGIGTKALCDAVRYAFTELDLCEVLANALKTNVRSRHVLEKAGFTRVGENAEYVFYRIDRQRNAEEETGSEAFGEPFVRSGDPSMEDA